jgi:hypothetical protein
VDVVVHIHHVQEVQVHVHIPGHVPVLDLTHVVEGLVHALDPLTEVQAVEAINVVIILGLLPLHIINDLRHHRVVIGQDPLHLLQDVGS